MSVEFWHFCLGVLLLPAVMGLRLPSSVSLFFLLSLRDSLGCVISSWQEMDMDDAKAEQEEGAQEAYQGLEEV